MAPSRIFETAFVVCGLMLCSFCGLLLAEMSGKLFTQLLDTCFNHLSTYLSNNTAPATIYQACVKRVSPGQGALFDASNLPSKSISLLHPAVNKPLVNSSLCDSGFVGNSDIYGLGVRAGLYVQWASSLLAKHLLREESTALMRSYLFFHVALCIAVVVLTFQKTCTFAVEIVLLYYLVYGGFICVFSRPNLGDSKGAMMDLRWSQVILSLSFWTMVTHAVWFIIFGRFRLPKMPCETTIFFFGPVDDDSLHFCINYLAVFLVHLICLVVYYKTVWICFFGFVSAVKILVSTMKSLLRGDFSPRVGYRSVVQLQSAISRYLRFSNLLEWLAAQPGNIRNKYGSALRRYYCAYTMCAYPSSRPFSTALIVRSTNQAVILAIGVFTFVWTILAIELTIHWNNISGMYVLDTTGQYVPLAVGLGGFVRLLYELLDLWRVNMVLCHFSTPLIDI